METLPRFMRGARADSGMRLYQLSRTACSTRLRYGPKFTPMVSLSTSTWLWLAGCEWAALIPFSVLPTLGLADSPWGVPAREPGAGCAMGGCGVGFAGTAAVVSFALNW